MLNLKSFSQGYEINIRNSKKASFPFRYHSEAIKIMNNGEEGVFNSVYIPTGLAKSNGTKSQDVSRTTKFNYKMAGKQVSVRQDSTRGKGGRVKEEAKDKK